MVDADLPCRLVLIVGMPSGGTSATAGTLTRNGFYNRGDVKKTEEWGGQSGFETTLPVNICANIWAEPYREILPCDVYRIAQWAKAYKQEALDNGFDKAVAKQAGSIIYMAESYFGPNQLGVKIEPLLVWRDPDACAASIRKRFSQVGAPKVVARYGQAKILRLHETYGWPMWRFGKGAKVEELEELLGVDLSEQHFDAGIVRH